MGPLHRLLSVYQITQDHLKLALGEAGQGNESRGLYRRGDLQSLGQRTLCRPPGRSLRLHTSEDGKYENLSTINALFWFIYHDVRLYALNGVLELLAGSVAAFARCGCWGGRQCHIWLL